MMLVLRDGFRDWELGMLEWMAGDICNQNLNDISGFDVCVCVCVLSLIHI